MKRLFIFFACLSIIACTPTNVENETEQFGIDKEEVESPDDRD
ncbi:hypothetical protein [Kordia sp.]